MKRRKTRHFADPPLRAVKRLESAACQNMFIARLTLGLYGAVLRDPSTELFPGYQWALVDIAGFPAPLRSAARKLVQWGQMRGCILNRIFVSRIAIVKAVRTMRRRSPYGRKCLAYVSKLRTKYPVIHKFNVFPPAVPNLLEGVNILEEAVGLPLTERTMRLVKAFQPSLIQISARNDPLPAENQSLRVVNIRLSGDGYTVESIRFTVKITPAAEKPRKIEGILIDHFETGTEGTLWALMDDDGVLHIIEPGHQLAILDQLGRKLWSGVIRTDRELGWRRYSRNPNYGQPCALGRWIHWTQKGFKPDDWARFFIRPDYDRLRGVLKKSHHRG